MDHLLTLQFDILGLDELILDEAGDQIGFSHLLWPLR
jgi:hypothetical protein